MTTIFIDDEPHYWADGPPGAFVPLAEADALEAQIAALTTERDSLRALVKRVNEIGADLTFKWPMNQPSDLLMTKLQQLLSDCQEALK